MIPAYHETLALLAEKFPGWSWLLRNAVDDPRGEHFFHLHLGFNPKTNSFTHSFKAWGRTPDQVVWQVYMDASSILH